jgi:hypothetical protein
MLQLLRKRWIRFCQNLKCSSSQVREASLGSAKASLQESDRSRPPNLRSCPTPVRKRSAAQQSRRPTEATIPATRDRIRQVVWGRTVLVWPILLHPTYLSWSSRSRSCLSSIPRSSSPRRGACCCGGSEWVASEFAGFACRPTPSPSLDTRVSPSGTL